MHEIRVFLWMLPLAILLQGVALWLTRSSTFLYDDFHILLVAARTPPITEFYLPERYQLLSSAHYTPTVTTLYRLLAWAFGPDPRAFHAAMFALSVLALASVATVAVRRTRRWEAGWFVVLICAGLPSLWTALGRYYTMHYWLGAAAAASAVLVAMSAAFSPLRAQANSGVREAPGAGGPSANGWVQRVALVLLPSVSLGSALAVALWSKEVYLMAVPILLVLAWQQRRADFAVVILLTTAIYLLARSWVLEAPLIAMGRTARPLHIEWLEVTPSQWWELAVWYLRNHTILVLAVGLALIRFPKRFLFGLPWALLFLVPILGASHGVTAPQLHADRLLLGFNLALAVVLASCFFAPDFPRPHRSAGSAKGELGAGGTGEAGNPRDFARRMRWNGRVARPWPSPGPSSGVRKRMWVLVLLANTALQVTLWRPPDPAGTQLTQRLLGEFNGSLEGQLVLVPPESGAGPLGVAFSRAKVTANCLEALDSAVEGRLHESLIVLDSTGARRNRNWLQERCVPFQISPVVEVIESPRYEAGILSWRLRGEPGDVLGIEAVDRALLAPGSELRERLVRPFTGERYRVFVRRGNQWWFSEPQIFEQGPSSPKGFPH